MAIASNESKTLVARQFGHELEEGDTPLDAMIGVRRKATSTDAGGYIEDRTISLTLDGENATGVNLARLGVQWPEAFGTAWYGGMGDFWGLTGITAEQVNAPEFGVLLAVFGIPGGESVGTHTSTGEVAEILQRVYFVRTAVDESRVCFSQRSIEMRSDGCYRQHPTDDVWGRVVEEGAPPLAPPSRGGRRGRTIIVPSQGDLHSLPDVGTNLLSAQAFLHRGYLFAREAAS